ncbi:MAG TPA: serine hydrolase [Acidimicrobiales bacterium]|nr:serine hydrolase [Acidimicrobiales bacterium]
MPPQPEGLPWPTEEWPPGPPPGGVDVEGIVAELFDEDGPLATTYAAVVIHRGRLVHERYAGVIEHLDAPPEPVTAATPLLSWSMAKSMLHAVIGMLVGDRRLATGDRAAVPEWQSDDDPRSAITIEQLLAMRDGLDFLEDYVDADRSDVIEMLFGSGSGDVAHFAADRTLAAPPGDRLNYSSGTSNVLSGIVARLLGPGEPYERFLHERLFAPIGMRTATARLDAAGTWIASSYVYCCARDFARFGYLYLRDGVWEGRRLLPGGWVDHGRTWRSVDDEGHGYGAHWWVIGDEHGSFRASGYEGQSIMVVPGLDLVVVRLGKTDAARYPLLTDWRRRVVEAFAASALEPS